MAILMHGTNLELAPTIASVVQQERRGVARALDDFVALGFVSAQLDATLPGIRPRELDRTARRELAAAFARRGVQLAGLDLSLPRQHYLESGRLDRAVSATVAGIKLAADLGKVPLNIALPVEQLGDDILAAMVEAADGHSVRLAVHAEDQLQALGHWVRDVDLPALGAAIDPAALIANGLDPVAVVHELADHLTIARLSDCRRNAELRRCVVGHGELDVATYRVALDLATGRTGPVVLDLLGLDDPITAATAAKTEWDRAAFVV